MHPESGVSGQFLGGILREEVILGLFQWFQDDALTSLGISIVFSSVDVLAPNLECPLGAPQITLWSTDPLESLLTKKQS